MSSYDDGSRRYYDQQPRADTRYVEKTEEYRPGASRELVPRTSSRLEAENMPVEPYQYQYERDGRRARSAAPYEDQYYGGGAPSSGSRYRGDYERGAVDRHRSSRKGSKFYVEEERARRRMLSKEQKIMAALAGAALLAGGKELYDRREAKEEGLPIHRNPLASAALGAAGALAGYQGAEMYSKQSKHRSKHVVRGRDGRVEEEYWTDESSGSSDNEKDKKHNSSFIKSALAAAGLGKAVKSVLESSHDRDRDRDDTRSERSSHRSSRSLTNRRSSSRSSSRGSRAQSESAVEKMQKAAVASLIAGASEAFRVSKKPGSWKGEKTKRIITAAVSAGGIDAAHDTKHTKMGMLESVMGGLLANRAIRGSKKDIEEDSQGRSRSRSRARSEGGGGHSVAGPVGAILGAIAGRKALSHSHSRSRSRGRHDDSDDSYDGRRRGKGKKGGGVRERSRSAVRKLLEKTGLQGDDNEEGRYDDNPAYYDEDDSAAAAGSRRVKSRRHRNRDQHGSRSRSRSRSVGSSRDRPRGGGGYDSGDDDDLGNSDEDEKHYKRMRGKSVISSGLAGVATIHAIHGVYQSYEKRQKRQKAVKEGRLSESEASRLRKKALLQDVASVGIATLGVKGAISEVKEAKDLNKQCKEFKHQKHCRHRQRIERQRGRRAGPGGSSSVGGGGGGGGGVGRSETWGYHYPTEEDEGDYGYYWDSETPMGRRSISTSRQLPAALHGGGYRSG